MASDESDDEPLSSFASTKKTDPNQFIKVIKMKKLKMKKEKVKPLKSSSITIKLSSNNVNPTSHSVLTQTVVNRPADVWLYLKDFNTTGPYSCLLCSDWFINRPKIIIHYVLNHKKDFCGICRYFVPDREAWIEHEKFHTPWPCSQCVESFPLEEDLRNHLRTIHNLVHCRLCHFRVPADDDYTGHLLQKHNVTNSSCMYEDMWQLDGDKFLCQLCSKADNLLSTFFSHYMGFHHFTLKCLSHMVSGKDPPFIVKGVDVSPQFINTELKEQIRCGYVGMRSPVVEENNVEPRLTDYIEIFNQGTPSIDISVIPDIKQEIKSDDEDANKNYDSIEPELQIDVKDEKVQLKTEKDCDEGKTGYVADELKDYNGEEDFDITLLELIVIEKGYFNYIDQMTKDIDAKIVPESSNIEYTAKTDIKNVECLICKMKLNDANSLVGHVSKVHSLKTVPLYSCRVCATSFETFHELTNHITEELGQFEDLWICQFCDKEFDNRESTRQHLSVHWEEMDLENCFSPHLGFKCKFCPTLFWNEPDREQHQIKVHLEKHKEQFYNCEECLISFGDKVWYIYHYLQEHVNERTQANAYLLKCCVCCTIMSNLDEIRVHFENNHPEARKLYCCMEPCAYRPLSHRKSLRTHVKTVHAHRAITKPISCHVCSREFATVRSCSAHIAQAHGTAGKFKCKLCREVLQTIDERKLHYLLRHPGRHPFECSECGKSFQYKSSLYMHKQEHQPNKQCYTCNYCGKEFAKKDSYREHVQIHEGPRHACSYCPMRFVQRSNMLRHERRHTGERPYACPHCARTFADKGACTSHVRTHSRDTSYACLYCGQTFVQKSKLTYHIRRHTGENLETCTVCSKLFTSACSLREHMKTHVTKSGNVKCPLCDKKYQDQRYMLRHLRSTHTNTQYSCPICQKTITSTAGLRHHVMTHSSLNMFRCKCCPKTYAVKRTMEKHLKKRHNLNSEEVNIKDYYSRLEPRDCQLNLDEETMTSIFGPPKKKDNDVLIADYVTFAKNASKTTESSDTDDKDDKEQNSEDNDEFLESSSEMQEVGESQEEVVPEFREVVCKQEVINPEYDIEPTDFVSVKIESVDVEGNRSE